MAKLYQVNLTEQERDSLLALIQKGRTAARRVRRAQILLAAADGQCDVTIARVLHSRVSTVERTRKRFVEAGLEAALHEQPRPGARRKLAGKPAAFLIALACSEPPTGRTRWTMPWLADRMVELGVVEALSDETVRRVLKKTRVSPGNGSPGVSPPSVRSSSGAWKTFWTCLLNPITRSIQSSASMKAPTNWSARSASHDRWLRAGPCGTTTNTVGKGRATCSCAYNPCRAGGMCR